MSAILDEKTIERFARSLILDLKGDPDQLVQPGSPTGYGTPSGDAFAVNPGAAVPLWRLYTSMARRVLTAAMAELERTDASPVQSATGRLNEIQDEMKRFTGAASTAA